MHDGRAPAHAASVADTPDTAKHEHPMPARDVLFDAAAVFGQVWDVSICVVAKHYHLGRTARPRSAGGDVQPTQGCRCPNLPRADRERPFQLAQGSSSAELCKNPLNAFPTLAAKDKGSHAANSRWGLNPVKELSTAIIHSESASGGFRLPLRAVAGSFGTTRCRVGSSESCQNLDNSCATPGDSSWLFYFCF